MKKHKRIRQKMMKYLVENNDERWFNVSCMYFTASNVMYYFIASKSIACFNRFIVAICSLLIQMRITIITIKNNKLTNNKTDEWIMKMNKWDSNDEWSR